MALKKKSASKKATSRSSVKKSSSVRRAPSRSSVGSASATRGVARDRILNLTKDVPQHQYFVLANGKPIKHVAELAAILDQLEDHVFNHHVNTDRNDFHNWVKDVFNDIELARKIAGVDDKKHLQLTIYKHLAGHE